MSPRELDIVTLENFNGGIVPVRFRQAMDEIMENIQDLNTVTDKERKVVITMSITPVDEERRNFATNVEVVTKLADRKGKAGQIYLGKEDGRPVFRCFDPQQAELDLDNDPQVTDIHRKEATS